MYECVFYTLSVYVFDMNVTIFCCNYILFSLIIYDIFPCQLSRFSFYVICWILFNTRFYWLLGYIFQFLYNFWSRDVLRFIVSYVHYKPMEFVYLSLPITINGFPWWFSGKEFNYQYQRGRFDPWVGKVPWRRNWQPTPVFLPGKSHGQRGCKESGMA